MMVNPLTVPPYFRETLEDYLSVVPVTLFLTSQDWQNSQLLKHIFTGLKGNLNLVSEDHSLILEIEEYRKQPNPATSRRYVKFEGQSIHYSGLPIMGNTSPSIEPMRK